MKMAAMMADFGDSERAQCVAKDPLATFKAASFALICGDRKLARILTQLAIRETRRRTHEPRFS